MRKANAFAAVVVCFGAICVSTPALGVDKASGSKVPADVAVLFAGPALEQAQASLERLRSPAMNAGSELLDTSQLPDFSGDAMVGLISEIFVFSAAFLDGRSTDLVSSGQWIAPVLRDDKVIGTLNVWKPDGGPAEVGGYNGDVTLGQALRYLRNKILVEDGPSGGWFAVSAFADASVTALNDPAVALLGSKYGGALGGLQQSVLKRIDESRAAAGVSAEPLSGGGSTAGLDWDSGMILGTVFAGIGLVGIAIFAMWPRKRRQAS